MSNLKEEYNKIMTEKIDPRVSDWLFMDSPLVTILAVTLYFIAVYGGRRWMKNRPAYDLKPLLVVFNIILVILSTYICYEFLITSWLRPGFSLKCEKVDYSNDPLSLRLAGAVWWFYISKLPELLDTIFFVLRKKNNQITFLHVFHHSTMPFLWWAGARFVPGGEAYFSASVNSFIHMLMYTYYGLSAMGPSMQKFLWWKKYMTKLQLIQFWSILLHTIVSLHVDCGFQRGYNYAVIVYMISHIVLFSNFYYQTYTKKKVWPRHNKVENGVQNGYINNVEKKMD